MQQIILHMGPHKTASTYLQQKLEAGRALLEPHGYCYPEAFTSEHGHHLINRHLRNGAGARTIRKSLDQACADAHTCILSDENLYRVDERGLDTLQKAFRDVTVRCLLFVRLPSMRMRSLWQELVKHGGEQSLGSYLMEHCLRPLASEEVNMAPRIDRLRARFGTDAVRLVDYDTAAAEGSLMATFLRAVGLPEEMDAPLTDSAHIVNAMLPLPEAELVRYMNIRARHEGFLRGANVREAYDELRSLAAEELHALGNALARHAKMLVLGNLVGDVLMHQLLQTRYGQLFVNEPYEPRPKECHHYEDGWMLDPRCLGPAQLLYRKARTLAKARMAEEAGFRPERTDRADRPGRSSRGSAEELRRNVG